MSSSASDRVRHDEFVKRALFIVRAARPFARLKPISIKPGEPATRWWSPVMNTRINLFSAGKLLHNLVVNVVLSVILRIKHY